MECLNDVVNEDLGNLAIATDKISKASWGEGFCKVCGIDENNKKVLLCDTCDAEYHTYCLRPPLAKHILPKVGKHKKKVIENIVVLANRIAKHLRRPQRRLRETTGGGSGGGGGWRWRFLRVVEAVERWRISDKGFEKDEVLVKGRRHGIQSSVISVDERESFL
ncbi:UNVERIFIED_CONTAM: Methyl-CpG-binding domain-containing protein 9 [Sesamum angustifolium]|uniref:Methyl-CpG-binding domain-containing protein 9 n=1 Tax=Sesamum angustifolium TaxID=2727405 RepID=A0AAW2NL61_9LAMI